MQTETDLNKIYNDELLSYNKTKEQIKAAENEKRDIEALILRYRQELELINNQEHNVASFDESQNEVKELQFAIENQRKLAAISQQQHQQLVDELNFQLIQRNIAAQDRKKRKEEEKNILLANLQLQKQDFINSSKKIQKLEDKKHIAQKQYQSLQKQLELLAKKDLKSIQAFQNQLKDVQAQLKGVTEAIKQAEFEKQTKVDPPQVDKIKKLISNTLSQVIKLQQHCKKYQVPPNQNQKKDFASQKFKQLKSLLEQVQKSNDNLRSSIQHLKRQIFEQKEKHKDDSKKQPEKNQKSQLIQAQRQKNSLIKQLQKLQIKLASLIKDKATYVSQKIYEDLRKEYDSARSKQKYNIIQEKAKNQKLKLYVKQLKSKVDYRLQGNQKQILNKKVQLQNNQKKLIQINGDKKIYEKHIETKTIQLKEYMHNFPDHEEKKQKIIKEKKIQQSIEKKKKLQQKKQQLKKKEQENKKQQKDQDPKLYFPPTEKTPFYLETKIQIIAAIVLLIIPIIISLI